MARDDERQSGIDLDVTVRFALWSGGDAVCNVALIDGRPAEPWFLVDIDSGRLSELRAYRPGMFRRGCRHA